MERLPYIAVLAAYAIVTIAHMLPAWTPKWPSDRVRWIAAFGAVVHAATLAWGAAVSPYGPGFPEALSATSLGIAVAYAWIGSAQMRALGMLLAPLAMVMLGTALVVPHHVVPAVAETESFSVWLPVHLFLIFSGIGGFGLSGGVGVLYLWARRQLKAKRFDQMGRLPSLETLDRIQFRAMLFGFVALTLGIGAGGAWAAATLTETWTIDPKVWATVIIWFWYGVALQVRLVAGRRGRWTALFSIVGFASLVSSLVGIRFLLSGWHGAAG